MSSRGFPPTYYGPGASDINTTLEKEGAPRLADGPVLARQKKFEALILKVPYKTN